MIGFFLAKYNWVIHIKLDLVSLLHSRIHVGQATLEACKAKSDFVLQGLILNPGKKGTAN